MTGDTQGWQPIETAPKDGTDIQVRIPGNGADNVIAWQAAAFLNDANEPCGGWAFTTEQEPPECWTDGICWEVNEDGKASVQPTEWKPLPEVQPMNAPHQFPDPLPSREGMAPTLEQWLRFVDLCFEAAAIASKTFPPIREEGHGLPRIANPHFGPAYNFQRAKMMREEGLPLSLLGDGKCSNQRHFERMARVHPEGNWPKWARPIEASAAVSVAT